ncbi:MAG: GAF domain-containing protein [Pseudomonadota bacterium]
MNVIAANTDARRSLIADTLAGEFRSLRFPQPLEDEFQAAWVARSPDVIRRVLPWALGLNLLYALIVHSLNQMPAAWYTNASHPISVLVFGSWMILLATRRLDGWIAFLTPLVVTCVQIATLRTLAITHGDPLAHAVAYFAMLQTFMVFTLFRMPLRTALLATLASMLVLLIDLRAEGLDFDWPGFIQHYFASVLLCSVICYLLERRERSEWLTTQQLAVEMQSLDALRKKADEEQRRQRRIGDYLARIAGNLTATEIAGRTLGFLIEHTGAQVGAVFLMQGERLRRAAASGLDGETRLPEDLGRGETLIGQAAVSRRRLRLTHLPEDYNAIRTATGSASPRELLVEPVFRDNETLAVIELGALDAFRDEAVDLLHHLAPAMAGALVAAHGRDALARAGIDDFGFGSEPEPTTPTRFMT